MKLINLKLTSKIITSFVLVLLIASIASLIAVIQFTDINSEIVELDKNMLPQYYDTVELSKSIDEQVMSLRAYMIYGDDKFAQQFVDVSKKSSDLEVQIINATQQQKDKDIMTKIKNSNDEYTRICIENVIPSVKAGDIEAAKDGGMTVLSNYQETQKLLNDYYAQKNEEIANVVGSINNHANSAKNLIIIFAIAAIVLAMVIAVLLTRMITKPIIETTEEMYKMSEQNDLTERQLVVNSNDEIGILRTAFNKMLISVRKMVLEIKESSTNLAAHSEELSATSEQVTSAVQEVVATINQLAVTVDEQNSSTSQVNLTAVEMSDNARQGSQAVESTMQKMNLINSSVVDSTTVITDLAKKSHEIGLILDVITNIASQTNLLALNAAIEAARAGDAGRGFAVVAEEVRKLAEQSASATKDIADIVREIRDQTGLAVNSMEEVTTVVKDGVSVSEQTGNVLSKLIEEIEQVSSMVDEISKGTENTSNMAQSLAAASQQTNANVEQVSSSAQELTSMAERLQGMTEMYKL
ncbi:methyl-accepting chemotaxis sensory transducer [Desulfofarcimen acetoxidans DSM 771]|jgi:methyl-accepting chemotaxis protein|uniref:Methyl-accepting chemotaxis sensory transducer n=1 Tax=Desulfofarcimen acetoxidans (strain ATCC 49208 / DSM 771 / KCTC 5769 / VKM B-1644 / 5575) TaxID=485916 RepID=C8W037_DESAS|nr:methyl-accepting chemotaxis protein [Desulfofarcimen acetoxidans]ACV65005.1 methyl-accepting chemotaxis sensory transducer [Desulfofarcimen acetoxidans DSM 771]